LVPEGADFWDYEAKYDGITTEICPGNFTDDEKRIMQDAAHAVHETLGLSHYSRSDFIVAPSGIYFLEVNTLPGLTPASLLPKSLEAVGVSFPQFLEHLLSLALNER
jgi:D-alanine-D-alanine ligase